MQQYKLNYITKIVDCQPLKKGIIARAIIRGIVRTRPDLRKHSQSPPVIKNRGTNASFSTHRQTIPFPNSLGSSNTVPEGGSVNMRGPENFFHKWLETCLGHKKIEGDWLESWRFRRNPRWPPRWRLFLSKMPIPL